MCGGNKRARTIFTAEQLDKMEQEFHKQQYVVGHERMYLANALNLTEAQVKYSSSRFLQGVSSYKEGKKVPMQVM